MTLFFLLLRGLMDDIFLIRIIIVRAVEGDCPYDLYPCYTCFFNCNRIPSRRGGCPQPPAVYFAKGLLAKTLSLYNVIARSVSDEAIPRIGHFTWDCFVAKAPRNDNPIY